VQIRPPQQSLGDIFLFENTQNPGEDFGLAQVPRFPLFRATLKKKGTLPARRLSVSQNNISPRS